LALGALSTLFYTIEKPYGIQKLPPVLIGAASQEAGTRRGEHHRRQWMKIQTKLARFLISISRTQARVRDVSKKLQVMKLACLLILLSRSRPRLGGRKNTLVRGRMEVIILAIAPYRTAIYVSLRIFAATERRDHGCQVLLTHVRRTQLIHMT
jgi:hypothetical protein